MLAASAPRSRGYRRSSSCIPSCFAGPLTSDDDVEDGPATIAGYSARRASWLSRFRGKKKTVPVNASPEAAAPPASVGGDAELSEIQSKILAPRKKSFVKVWKDKDKSSRAATKYHHPRHHQAPLTAGGVRASTAPQKSPCIHRSSACTQPSPLHRMPDPATTETATSHPGPPKRHHPAAVTPRHVLKKCKGISGEIEPGAGLMVVAVTLAMLLLFGRACAIICMSAWFYLLPRLRAAADTVERKGSVETVDADSQEQKKRVVLQGLLERNGRKPWGSLAISSPAGAR